MKRTKRANQTELFDVLSQDKTSVDDFVLYKKTRRREYYLNKNLIHHQAVDSLKNKKYQYSCGRILIPMCVATGPCNDHVIDGYLVDVGSVKLPHGYLMAVDPIINAWVERVLSIEVYNAIPCININCPGYFSRERYYFGLPIRCRVCDECQCPPCQVSWEIHQGKSCFQISQEKHISTKDAAMQFLTGDYQLCPGCGYFTTKDSGCNHVKCDVCSLVWCWACGYGDLVKVYGSQYGHFKDDAKERTHNGIVHPKCIAGGEFTRDIKHLIVDTNLHYLRNIIHKKYPDIKLPPPIAGRTFPECVC